VFTGETLFSVPCSGITNPTSCQNLQPHKHHPALTFAIQKRLNMTSSIPVDKPLPVPGHVPVFLRIMTSDFGVFGKRGTTGTAAGSVVPEFSRGPPGLPGGGSPTETSLRSRAGGRAVLLPAGSIRKIFFLPAHDPAEKTPSRPELKRLGKFYAGDFWSGQKFMARPVLPGKFRCDSRLGPG